ncbi:MAG: hypothetical protein WC622_16760 [Pedobacter sp.]|jgi:hypothetical protein|uniref:hypothetical protein n=1 Tax=Pedobacter sp. TaxID=1411316 RepID=UPI003561A5E9
MSKEEKTETCKVAAPSIIMERVRWIKQKCKEKGKKLKIQDMVSESLDAYCDDMEKELNKSE